MIYWNLNTELDFSMDDLDRYFEKKKKAQIDYYSHEFERLVELLGDSDNVKELNLQHCEDPRKLCILVYGNLCEFKTKEDAVMFIANLMTIRGIV